jgi:hypothetical protein
MIWNALIEIFAMDHQPSFQTVVSSRVEGLCPHPHHRRL